MTKIYGTLKAWHASKGRVLPGYVQSLCKRMPAARDKYLDENHDRVKRAPVIAASTIRNISRLLLRQGSAREILAWETFLIAVVSMCRGNEVLERQAGDM